MKTQTSESVEAPPLATLATKGEASGDVKAFIDFVLGPKGRAIVEEQKLIKIK